MAPTLPEHNAKLIADKELGFEILHDARNAYADTCGLRFTLPDELRAVYGKFGIDLAEANGDDSWTLHMPARYVVGADGRILAADVNADYTRRPEPEESLAALPGPGG